MFIDESHLETTIWAPDDETAEPEQQRSEVGMAGLKRGKYILVTVGGYGHEQMEWFMRKENKGGDAVSATNNGSVMQAGKLFRKGALLRRYYSYPTG